MSGKTERTKAHIITIFLEEMAAVGFDKITVSGLAKKAQINRGTFYLYFEDKYALLEEIQDDIYQTFSSLLERNISDTANKNWWKDEKTFEYFFVNASKKTMNYLYEQGEVTRLMLGKNGDPRFISKLEQAYSDAVRKKLSQKVSYLEDYSLEYIMSGAIAIVKKWLRDGLQHSPDEMTAILAECVMSKPSVLFNKFGYE